MAQFNLFKADVRDFLTLWPEIRSDFPAGTLAPRMVYTRVLQDGSGEFFRFFASCEPVGYALVLRGAKHNIGMIWLLAVHAAYRSQGHGGAMLEALHARYALLDGMILEVERVCDAKDDLTARENARRIRFYERAGYSRLPKDVRLYGENYHIMACALTDGDFLRRAGREEGTLYRSFYGRYAPLRFI